MIGSYEWDEDFAGSGLMWHEGMPVESEPDRSRFLGARPISVLRELGAYERLWLEPTASFKRLATLFKDHPGALPSEFVPSEEALAHANEVLRIFDKSRVDSFGVRVHGAGEYPARLRDALEPVELLYYRGWWDLAADPRSVAVVGARESSDEGERRARRIAKLLVENRYVVVSGLAAGIDSAALRTAIELGGRTIAVIGTPVCETYPKENAELQQEIAENHLLISQVPVLRYQRQDWRRNRLFFPERNKTMSALTAATVIVEASDTSGTLTQARAALAQGRKLFILNSCFERPGLNWPHAMEKKGAVRVKNFDSILEALEGE
jgi:DNA processing protein